MRTDKNQLRFLLLVCAAFLALTATALAKASDSVDSSYNFKNVRKVLICDIDDPNDQVADSEEASLQSSYHLQAKDKLELPSLTEEDLEQELIAAGKKPDDSEAYAAALVQRAQMYVRARFDKYEQTSYTIPAHTEWQTVRERASYKDKDGKWREMWVDRSVPVFVPDRTVPRIAVQVTFTGCDARTNKVVFLRTEERHDIETTDRPGMFNRIVRSYFRDLRKKIKQ